MEGDAPRSRHPGARRPSLCPMPWRRHTSAPACRSWTRPARPCRDTCSSRPGVHAGASSRPQLGKRRPIGSSSTRASTTGAATRPWARRADAPKSETPCLERIVPIGAEEQPLPSPRTRPRLREPRRLSLRPDPASRGPPGPRTRRPRGGPAHAGSPPPQRERDVGDGLAHVWIGCPSNAVITSPATRPPLAAAPSGTTDSSVGRPRAWKRTRRTRPGGSHRNAKPPSVVRCATTAPRTPPPRHARASREARGSGYRAPRPSMPMTGPPTVASVTAASVCQSPRHGADVFSACTFERIPKVASGVRS